MPSILIDTGVWYSLCDQRDRMVGDKSIGAIQKLIAAHSIAFPWPIAYETLRTRLVRNRLALERFEQQLKSARVEYVDDSPYRMDALALSIDSSLHRARPLSMVDCLMRIFMDDADTRIRYLVTFNVGDFADICAKRKIEIWHA